MYLDFRASVYYVCKPVKPIPGKVAMKTNNNTYGSFSLSTLKKLRTLLPKLRKLPAETRKLAQAKRAKMEKLLPANFTWAELYDLSAQQLNILGLAVMGLLDPLAQAAREGLNLNEFLVQEAVRDMNSGEDGEDYSGGHNGLFKIEDVIAVHYANLGMLLGVFHYGHYLNDLVAMARNGNDDAYFKAVRVDQTALTCPSFAARLARAHLFGEKKFMRRLRSAMNAKPHDALLMNQDLRFMLHILHEAKALADLTLSEADVLFIQELKLYSDNGKDPARSLMRFIQRWKADHPAT